MADPSTGPKILVSSPISRLLSGSTEVKLALMAVSESVEMLSHAAGLDSVELPASLVEIAEICGRLPLCLNIAARMIADCGENWIEEVVVSYLYRLRLLLINLGCRYYLTYELATAGRVMLVKGPVCKILS